MGPVHLPGPLRLLDFQETGTLTSHCVLCAQIHRKTNDDFSLLSSSLFKWLFRVLPSSYCTSQDWARKCFKLHRTRADWLSRIVALKLTTLKVRLFYVVNLCVISFKRWTWCLFSCIQGELDANRPVPFRLTPNIAEFVTPVGVNGVMTAAIVSAARCLAEPHFSVQSVLRAVLRDEMIAWHKKVRKLL